MYFKVWKSLSLSELTPYKTFSDLAHLTGGLHIRIYKSLNYLMNCLLNYSLTHKFLNGTIDI